MFRILVMNGLLISLIFMWTSAAKDPLARPSSEKFPTGPQTYSVSEHQVSVNENPLDARRRRRNTCRRELDGKCVRRNRMCPSSLPLQTSPGKPYCSKRRRCCYQDTDTTCQFKSLQERREYLKLWPGRCGGEACEVIWSSNYPGFAPLILTGNSNDPEIIRVDSVEDGALLRFTCPDASNSFKYHNKNYLDTDCKDGKLVPYAIKDLGCETWVRATITPDRKNGPTPATCANKKGEVYEIVFEADFSNGTPDIRLFPLISVCFDKNEATTLMTKHTLSYLHKADNKDPPDFRTSTGFFTVAMSRIYTQKEQAFLFSDARLNLQQQLICDPKYPNTYLQKGHMAPKGDFVTKAEQDATFYYINALPQWSSINNGNWKVIETAIRNTLITKDFNLEIYSGGYQVLHLENMTSSLVPLFLSDVYDVPNKLKKVPVPNAIWKVVHQDQLNQAVAFLVINNPFNPSAPSHPNSQCNKLNWLSIDPSYQKGFTYCFTVKDFKSNFPTIDFPSLGAADDNLLI